MSTQAYLIFGLIELILGFIAYRICGSKERPSVLAAVLIGMGVAKFIFAGITYFSGSPF